MSSRIRTYALVAFAALVALASGAALAWGLSSTAPELGTWPETAQWSTLDTGQDRWSRHETNLTGVCVLVDHEEGVAYLETGSGVCRMTDANGTPLLDAEAER